MAFCLTKFAVSGLYNKFYFMVPSIYYSFLTMAKTEPSPPNACLPCSCNVAAAGRSRSAREDRGSCVH